jgi:hypothetical protein
MKIFFAGATGVLGRRVVPQLVVNFLGSLGQTPARSQRISNRKLKAESRWAPRYPSMRAGWQAVLGFTKGSNQMKEEFAAHQNAGNKV